VGTGALDTDLRVTLLVNVDIVGTVGTGKGAQTFLLAVSEGSLEHGVVGSDESTKSMELTTVHVTIVLLVLNTFRVVNTGSSMGLALKTVASECATVGSTCEALKDSIV
jgi:hypothetical protein